MGTECHARAEGEVLLIPGRPKVVLQQASISFGELNDIPH